ncbi:DEAD/DEAH box helicase [Lactobacillus sp. HT06-2]|uniref:DEAD/DEAH box helicase n=1 Tax=Lactobacillus sp. HT06-2 TaxID=2080222 RepID=UPI000CD80B15|nr:DEAD/DEAH box helicase [Lactobacillus sp. HT06-2]
MASWQGLFSERIFDRGYEYFYEGKVKKFKFDQDGEHFIAIVAGAEPLSYRVSGRLRPDGRVSELSCSCPWANKGHRCKHEVAALLKAEKVQPAGPDLDLIPSPISDWISSRILHRIDHADLDVDPTELVKAYRYTEADYDEARQLDRTIDLHDYNFEQVNSDDFIYHVIFHAQFLKYQVNVYFTRNAITDIDVNSPIKNFGTKPLEILALLRFVNDFAIDRPTEKTNAAARQFLKRFGQTPTSEPTVFRLELETDRWGELSLFFRIGTADHLYKIQNIDMILSNIAQGDRISLGKFFNQVVDLDQMDPMSRKAFNFIRQIIQDNNVVQKARGEYYGVAFKSLPVEGMLADKLSDLMAQGVTLYSGNRPIIYSEEKRQLPIRIRTDVAQKVATVDIGGVVNSNEMNDLLRGQKGYYLYDGRNHWTKLVGVSPQLVQKLGFEGGERLQFGPDSLRAFGREILPELKKTGEVEITGDKDLEPILPPAAQLIYHLDYRDDEIICDPVAKYGDDQYHLLVDQKSLGERDPAKEKAGLALLDQLHFDKLEDKYVMPLGAGDNVDNLFENGIDNLNQFGQVDATAAFKRLMNNIKSKVNVSLGIKLASDTLNLTVDGDKLSPEDIDAILTAYHEKKHYFVLKNGEVRRIDSPSMEELANTMASLGLSLKKFVHGKMAVPAYRAFYLEKQLEKCDTLSYTSNSAFDQIVHDLEKGSLQKVEIPPALSKILRPYQKQGFKWLSTLINYNLGGLLADEMGLGKTLQVISVILSRHNKTDLPSLIVVPASVVYNWENEFKKWAPDIQTVLLGGDKKERRMQLAQVKAGDVLITSYDSLKRDLELYQDLKFDLEVIDEAQNIKNARSLAAKAVKIMQAHHRIALTGTPIENNLSELWSIFDYLMPGFLGNYDFFRKVYEKPIVQEEDEDLQERLSQIIAPFVLRRLKKDVLKDLPDKSEEVVYAALSGKQAELYSAQVQKLLNQLGKQNEAEFKKNRFQALAAITRLRELCCDPHLLYENYRGKSAKLTATLNLIQQTLADGHKILLFSQFTSMLAIFKEKLGKLKIPFFEITGATPKVKRQELINEFNQLDESAVFLISLKAGGTGINLTSADVVIHYDPWWNVAAENQATDRAHRIGQKHNVQIYKMVAKGTIEEKIIALQERKQKLAEEVLNGEQLSSSTLDKDDLLAILQRD